MKKLLIIVIALMLTQACYVNAQPQWKFYLAFEDGIGAKDTMWFIWDTTAMFFGIDTLLGEGNVQFDYNVFNVWALTWGIYPEIDTTKIVVIPYEYAFETYINAFNYILPIKLTWDTALLHAEYLPPEPVGWVNQAYLYSLYFFFVNNDPMNGVFDMTLIDTAMSPDPSITDPWFWNPAIHFPLSIHLYQDPSTSVKTSGFDIEQNIQIFPNPVKDYLLINCHSVIQRVFIYNLNFEMVLKTEVKSCKTSIDVSLLPNGIYFLNLINNKNQNHYEKFIKTD